MENFSESVQGLWSMYTALPWWGMLISGLVVSALGSQLFKMTKNAVTTTAGVVKTAVKVVGVPFRMARWAVHLVVPEDINSKYKGVKSLTLKDILRLNTHFAKNGTDEVDSDLLVLFTESLENLRDARGRTVRVRDIASYYGKKNSLNGEVSRPVLELTSRGDARAQDIIKRFSDEGATEQPTSKS